MAKTTNVFDERTCTVCGCTLRHRLLQTERGYYVEATLSGETVSLFAGTDFLVVAVAYVKIVRGAVTPCTLADVLHDLLAEAVGA